MTHRASPKFWRFYEQLPVDIQRLADKNFALLKNRPAHESLHFKKVGRHWSARIGIHYRTVAIAENDTRPRSVLRRGGCINRIGIVISAVWR